MIVMDMMTVGDMGDYGETESLTDAQREVIEGKVRLMHDLGYCHNDLHSGNIFVTRKEDGEYDFFVGDFGFAERLPQSGRDRNEMIARDMEHIRQVTSFVNRDHIKDILRGMVLDGTVVAAVDLQTTHSVDRTDMFDYR